MCLTFPKFYLLDIFSFSFCKILVSAHTGCICSGDLSLSLCRCLRRSNWWELQCVVPALYKRLALFAILPQTAALLTFFFLTSYSLQGWKHTYIFQMISLDQMENRLKLMNRYLMLLFFHIVMYLSEKKTFHLQHTKSESET